MVPVTITFFIYNKFCHKAKKKRIWNVVVEKN